MFFNKGVGILLCIVLTFESLGMGLKVNVLYTELKYLWNTLEYSFGQWTDRYELSTEYQVYLKMNVSTRNMRHSLITQVVIYSRRQDFHVGNICALKWEGFKGQNECYKD